MRSSAGAKKGGEGMVRENLLTKLLEWFKQNSWMGEPIPESV